MATCPGAQDASTLAPNRSLGRLPGPGRIASGSRCAWLVCSHRARVIGMKPIARDESPATPSLPQIVATVWGFWRLPVTMQTRLDDSIDFAREICAMFLYGDPGRASEELTARVWDVLRPLRATVDRSHWCPTHRTAHGMAYPGNDPENGPAQPMCIACLRESMDRHERYLAMLTESCCIGCRVSSGYCDCPVSDLRVW